VGYLETDEEKQQFKNDLECLELLPFAQDRKLITEGKTAGRQLRQFKSHGSVPHKETSVEKGHPMSQLLCNSPRKLHILKCLLCTTRINEPI